MEIYLRVYFLYNKYVYERRQNPIKRKRIEKTYPSRITVTGVCVCVHSLNKMRTYIPHILNKILSETLKLSYSRYDPR